MVAWNGDDLAGIMHVRTVELVAVHLVFVWAVDHIAKMEEERGIIPRCIGLIIQRHVVGDCLLPVVVAGTPGVAYRMEANGADTGDLRGARSADDVVQRHHRRTSWRRDRADLLARPIQSAAAICRQRWAILWRSRGVIGVGVP